MDALDWTGLIALGFAAGMAGGLVGVGGGVLSVPAFALFAHLTQLARRRPRLCHRARLGRRHLAPARLRQPPAPRGLLLSFAAVQLLFAWQLAKKAGLR
jgi:hypothetical protein